MKAQRVRIRYRVTAAAAGLSQRDLVSAWEGAAQKAGLPLAYSEGKRPSPRISLAAPLPIGATSDWELVDIFLGEVISAEVALERLRSALPESIQPLTVSEVGVAAPSLQSQLRWADYEVELPRCEMTSANVQAAIRRFLSLQSFPFEYRRETKVRSYDLRPLVLDLRLAGESDTAFVISMRLAAEQDRTARAEQVVVAVGLCEPVRIHRVRLHVEDVSTAIIAYRRAGERDE